MIRVSPHKCHMVSRMLLQPIYYFCFLLRFGQMLRFIYVVKRLPLADMLNIVASFHSALLDITFFNQYIISSFDVFCHIYAYDQLLLLVCSPAESRNTVCFFLFFVFRPGVHAAYVVSDVVCALLMTGEDPKSVYGYAPSPYGSSSTNTHALLGGLYGTNGQDRFEDAPGEEELRRRLSLHNTPAPDTPSMDDDSRGLCPFPFPVC